MPNLDAAEIIKPEDVIIDIGLAVKTHNDKHPDKRKKTQLGVSQKVNTTTDTFTKWKKKAPKLIADLLNIMRECDCDLTDFVKLKEKTQ